MLLLSLSVFPLVVICALGAPQTERPTTSFPLMTCASCDDDVYGCNPESVDNEVCQIGTTSCMVEMFFAPNNSMMFTFRAGCSSRHSCPEGYTKLMCTDFYDGVKTCRLCCLERNCHDPTPGSEMRISIMRDLMLQAGFQPEAVDEHLTRETQIAFRRGVLSSTASTSPNATPTASTVMTTASEMPVVAPTHEEMVQNREVFKMEEAGARVEDSREESWLLKAEKEDGAWFDRPAEYPPTGENAPRSRMVEAKTAQFGDEEYNEETAESMANVISFKSVHGDAARILVNLVALLWATWVAAGMAV